MDQQRQLGKPDALEFYLILAICDPRFKDLSFCNIFPASWKSTAKKQFKSIFDKEWSEEDIEPASGGTSEKGDQAMPKHVGVTAASLFDDFLELPPGQSKQIAVSCKEECDLYLQSPLHQFPWIPMCWNGGRPTKTCFLTWPTWPGSTWACQ